MILYLALENLHKQIARLSQLSVEHPLSFNVEETRHFWKGSGRNSADFDAIPHLCDAIRDSGLNKVDSVVIVGGINEGQYSETFLRLCPNVTFHGFEIQRRLHDDAMELIGRFPHAKLHNIGWSDREDRGVQIGGSGQGAGLYDPKGQRGWKLSKETVSTVTLNGWTSASGIDKVTYLVIDTEGHEPKVLRGMRLQRRSSQMKFPLFQFELGGTWAENDSRHGKDTWTQQFAAMFLHEMGYDLFLIGGSYWLYTEPSFFNTSESNPALRDEGFGPFVQGNLLAMHREFTPSELRNAILRNAIYITKPAAFSGTERWWCKSNVA